MDCNETTSIKEKDSARPLQILVNGTAKPISVYNLGLMWPLLCTEVSWVYFKLGCSVELGCTVCLKIFCSGVF